jgi:hypothetical protein
VVNRVENDGQHDRTPLFDQGDGSTGSFPGDFAELGKWFRRPGRLGHEAASQHREFGRHISASPAVIMLDGG